MKISYPLIAFIFLLLNGCSDYSSDSSEYELSGKMYVCDGSVQGDIINDSKFGKKYCNGDNWITLIPEDSVLEDSTPVMYECENGEVVKYKDLCTKNPSDYLPLDDTEYPYAGIPRIVIETENHKGIKDRETEIPAKLQIWGERAPESEIMELTIRGRGNSSWTIMPKKSYAIKFSETKSILQMPSAKKWVFLANYRDRTLIRNAIALEIARRSGIGWTPQGKFTELILNDKYLGLYYVCEKIEKKKNRLNIKNNSFLLELDTYYDEAFKFKTAIKKLPVNIKYPDSVSENQKKYIQSFLDSTENFLYKGKYPNSNLEKFIDIKSFALYWIIYELATNSEPKFPKSVYMYKENQFSLKLGPIWDFDWNTFTSQKNGLLLRNSLWFDSLLKNESFINQVKTEWENNKNTFSNLIPFIDSLVDYTKICNERNISLWPIILNDSQQLAGDESLDLDNAIGKLKRSYSNRIYELDVLFSKL